MIMLLMSVSDRRQRSIFVLFIEILFTSRQAIKKCWLLQANHFILCTCEHSAPCNQQVRLTSSDFRRRCKTTFNSAHSPHRQNVSDSAVLIPRPCSSRQTVKSAKVGHSHLIVHENVFWGSGFGCLKGGGKVVFFQLDTMEIQLSLAGLFNVAYPSFNTEPKHQSCLILLNSTS